MVFFVDEGVVVEVDYSVVKLGYVLYYFVFVGVEIVFVFLCEYFGDVFVDYLGDEFVGVYEM